MVHREYAFQSLSSNVLLGKEKDPLNIRRINAHGGFLGHFGVFVGGTSAFLFFFNYVCKGSNFLVRFAGGFMALP